MFQSPFARAASAYQNTQVQTGILGTDQHQLVVLLFEGVLRHLTQAQVAIEQKQVAVKCNEISKAMRILEEGLMTGLDLVDGGELAQNLNQLYDYCLVRMAVANARNDAQILAEVAGLLSGLLSAWREIRPKTAAASVEPRPLLAPRPASPEYAAA
jgi:flagellar protein FliS